LSLEQIMIGSQLGAQRLSEMSENREPVTPTTSVSIKSADT
jgi:hypothetical protein